MYQSSPQLRVAFVTEELAEYCRSGGIGTAVSTLARALASKDHIVDVFFVPGTRPSDIDIQRLQARFSDLGVRLSFVDTAEYTSGDESCEKRSYAVYRTLGKDGLQFDVIHFHDYKGLGFHCIKAKQQGHHFAGTHLVTQVHGPFRWTIDVNDSLFSETDQLHVDYMERQCIAQSDHLIVPSHYILSWLESNNFKLPPLYNVHVIKNLVGNLPRTLVPTESPRDVIADEIIFFGRHEDRKGFSTFCDALDLIASVLEQKQVSVTFLGKLGLIDGTPSGIVLTDRAKRWTFKLKIICNYERDAALHYIADSARCVVVIPSAIENLPYTVAEAICLNKPVVTSAQGGAPEWLHPRLHDRLLCVIEKKTLAEKIGEAVSTGLPVALLAEPNDDVAERWHRFHRTLGTPVTPRLPGPSARVPKVVFGITHYERPEKLQGAVISALRQTYDNMEVVVLDDGSNKPATLAALTNVERTLRRSGGRLLTQANAYLGAARNAIARQSESDYLLFLDDDDIAFEGLVETLVRAAEKTGADIVGCLSLYMDEQRRAEGCQDPERFEQKVSYIPTGGPLSLAACENWLGSATALIRRTSFDKVGGYSELQGVGLEDYEFYLRCLQAGMTIEIAPCPLFLYEVGRPSMTSTTSSFRNYRRIAKAIDVTRNAAAWADLVDLTAGRRALEQDRLKRYLGLADIVGREDADALFNPSGSLARHIDALCKYAMLTGSAQIVWDWHVASARPAQPSLAGSPPETDGIPVRLAELKGVLFHAHPARQGQASVLAMEVTGYGRLRRWDDAAALIIRSVSSTRWIDRDIAQALRVFASARAAALSKRTAELINICLDATVPAAEVASVCISLILLATELSLQHIVVDLAESLFALDERDYLDRNGDVLDSLADTDEPQSGLDHYAACGFEEGRRGFERTTSLCAAINVRTKLALRPWTLPHYLGLPLGPGASTSAKPVRLRAQSRSAVTAPVRGLEQALKRAVRTYRALKRPTRKR